MKIGFSRKHVIGLFSCAACLGGILGYYLAQEPGYPEQPPAKNRAPARTGSKTVVEKDRKFPCTPERLWDGDGPLWCKEGPRIRLAGIAARELDGSCRENHPCPPASGVVARNELARLLGSVVGTSSDGHLLVEGPALSCVSAGSGNYGRTSAWCVSPNVGDISCLMVEEGMALRWHRFWAGHECLEVP